ncbi:MAG: cytochrome c, partial [Candidatus Saccharimonas sp.]|nr:cytochrome c [Planctomycetaceae bacterium]
MFRHSSKPQWATNASGQLACWMLFGIVCGLSGCGQGPQAEFQYRDSTLKLIPDAQKAMKKTLKEGFGTPHDLVAWERFPIAYGGAKGSVSAPAEGATSEAKTVAAAFEGDAPKVAKGSPLLWLTGARAGEKSATDTVETYDAKTNQLKWSGSAEPVPAPGDKFVVGFGQALQQGRAVYMKNCMHCHGVSGDGAGPTAEYLYPRPRDYRLGVFKFTSTLAAEKVSRDDLHRIVKYGIPGTYMPSFLLLGEAETKSVVEYVRWLSVRGEFEKRTDDDLADFSQDAVDDTVKKAAANARAATKAGEKSEKPISSGQARKEASEAFAKYQKEDMETAVEDTATFLADVWTRADDAANVIVPSVPRVADDAASRERGRLLYMSDKTKCYTC